MKKIKKEIVIPEHKESVTKFVAEDGTEFNQEWECINYEGYGECENKIKHLNRFASVEDVTIPNACDTIAVYIKNKEEYADFIEYLRRKERTSYLQNNFDGENWYLFEYNYGRDGLPWYDVYLLTDIMDEWNNFINQFKEN